MLLTVLSGVIGGLCSVALLALVTSQLGGGQEAAPFSTWRYVWLVLALLASNLVSRSLLTYISQEAVLDLRLGLCRKVLDAPLSDLEQTGAHRVIGALTEDIGAVTNALLEVPNFCINVTILAGCLIYLGWLSPTMLPFLIAFFVTVTVSVKFLQSRSMRLMKAAREEWDVLVGCFHALMDGAKELKTHRRRRQSFIDELLSPAAVAHRQHSVASRRLLGVTASWTQALYFVFIGLALFVLNSSDTGHAQALIGYTLTALYMRTPMAVVMESIPSFLRANVSLKKVEELGLALTSEHDGQARAEHRRPRARWGGLELAGVTHTYRTEREDRNFVLGPLNLELSPGELVFISGGNGSGKTTLAKIITGLYTPEGGEVRIGGEAVTDYNRDNFRQHFSVVFSVPFLFKQLLGLSAEDLDEQAGAYVTKLHLEHKIEVRGGKLSTTALSQGQRKRLALLTAYLEDRPIYVFDEWAADQDPVFKEIFYLHLLPELKAKGKTVVVISHDDRYYHVADRVIKLENGQIESEYGASLARQPQPGVGPAAVGAGLLCGEHAAA